MGFMQTLRVRWQQDDSLVCVGLDPEPTMFPATFDSDPDAILSLRRGIVAATADYVC